MTQCQTTFSRILTIKLIMANLVWNRQTIGAPIVYCIVLKSRVPGNDAFFLYKLCFLLWHSFLT